MNTWISQHRIITFIIYNSIFWALCLTLLLAGETRLTILLGPLLLGLLLSLLLLFSASRQVIIKAVKQYNEQCDPNVLLKPIEEQLQKVKSKTYRQMLLMNKAVALRDLGRFDEALSILTSINIDQFGSTLPITKIVYYNNLTDILIIRGDFYQAEIWHVKMKQIISDIKVSKKQRDKLNRLTSLNQIELFIAYGNYSEAENLLNSLSEPMTTRQQISKHLSFAKLYMGQNKPDKARECLQFVVSAGNKIYDGLLAQRMLYNLAHFNSDNPRLNFVS